MEEGSITKVVNDFLTLSDGEISLTKGDIVQVLEKVDRHWWYGCCGGKFGRLPASHLMLLDIPALEDDHELFATLAGFPRQQDGDLSFSKGELIVGLSQVNADWWFGKIGERTGVFPTTYTWQLDSQRLKMKCKPQALHLRARVKMNMKAQLDEEMDLHEGDIITVTQIIDKSWYRGTCGTDEGVFPAAYVEIIDDGSEIEVTRPPTLGKIGSAKSNFESVDSLLTLSPEAQFPPVNQSVDEQPVETTTDTDIFDDDYFKVNMPSMYRNNAPDEAMKSEVDVVPYGITLYPFFAQFDNELSFYEGEIVTLCRHIDNDWIEGKIDGKKGIFPKSYVNILVDCEDFSGSMVAALIEIDNLSSENTVTPNLFAKVLYKFDAQMDGDLTVHKDEVVWIVRNVNKDWCEVKNKAGSVGLCPQNYLTSHLLPDDVQNKLSRGTSLATDDLLGYFSESQQPAASTKESHAIIPPSHRYSTGLDTIRQETSPIIAKIAQDDKVEEVKLRRRPPLYRRESARFPHRPAPPIPVPGQKPVHRKVCHADVLPESAKEEPEEENEGTNSCRISEHERKNAEHRQNVITELVLTEKEYVRDLKITYETFNLHDPRHLEARGIDVKVVFGNILEVLRVAEDLLDKLQFAMKGKDDDDQCVGPCFVEMADQMKCVYGQYCMNHNNALILLEKYESVEEIQRLFSKGIETLRMQVACFDMGSILIKPVQRILKYPLILNELIKCTSDSHKDKPELLNAVRTMMDVATYINEYKRRKDIVSKYLDDGNATISSRMSRLSLHSVAKKSTRIGVMLTSTLFGVATKDPLFDEQEFMFHTVEKTVRNFLKDVEIFLCGMQEKMSHQLNIGLSTVQFYQDIHSDAEGFCKLQHVVCQRFWKEFRKIVEQRVLGPLNTLMDLFEGPAILIQKRHDKLLDFDGSFAKSEKNKDNRLVQEELLAAKSNYEALNSHLLEELPTLNSLACEMLIECLGAFIVARKMLAGKITKEYLALMESQFMKSSQGDPIETFAVKHTLVWNQLGRFSFCPKTLSADTQSKRDSKTSPVFAARKSGSEVLPVGAVNQSPSQQAYLHSRYPRDGLYTVVRSHTATEALELSVDRGNVVGVIKKHDPLGDSRRWFIDDGSSKGFIPSNCLEPVFMDSNSVGSKDTLSTKSKEDESEPGKISPSLRRSQGPPPSSPSFRRSQVPPPPPPSYEEVMSTPDSCSENKHHEPAESHVYEEIKETKFFYAAYDFEANGPNMLSVKTGQVVFVVKYQDEHGNAEWWLVEDRFGVKGYVPAAYLKNYEQ